MQLTPIVCKYIMCGNSTPPPIILIESKMKKYKGIARIDQDSKRTHGWYVRVGFQGETASKFFSDRKWGGRQASLKSAVAWRNIAEIKFGKIRSDKYQATVAQSSTGVVGVCLNERLNRYQVSWVTAEGKQGKTSVSIRKHGKEAAFIKACAIRQAKERLRLEG